MIIICILGAFWKWVGESNGLTIDAHESLKMSGLASVKLEANCEN